MFAQTQVRRCLQPVIVTEKDEGGQEGETQGPPRNTEGQERFTEDQGSQRKQRGRGGEKLEKRTNEKQKEQGKLKAKEQRQTRRGNRNQEQDRWGRGGVEKRKFKGTEEERSQVYSHRILQEDSQRDRERGGRGGHPVASTQETCCQLLGGGKMGKQTFLERK